MIERQSIQSRPTEQQPPKLEPLWVRTMPYSDHLFTTARDPLVATPSVYNLPHPADAVIVMGTSDYQVEFDREVSTTTPVNNALTPLTAELRVNTKITYQIPQSYVELFGDVRGVLYVYLFWY